MVPDPIVSEDTLRRMKAMSMSDDTIARMFGCGLARIKKLRQRWGIEGMKPSFSTPNKGRPSADDLADGWPVVMAPDERDRVWKRYFERLGRDHSDGEVRFKRAGLLRCQPDRSHLHGLGATSLEF